MKLGTPTQQAVHTVGRWLESAARTGTGEGQWLAATQHALGPRRRSGSRIDHDEIDRLEVDHVRRFGEPGGAHLGKGR